MSDTPDKESKTEEPSEKKLRDSIEKGKVPHLREIAIAASLAAILLFAIFMARDAALALTGLLGRLLGDVHNFRFETGGDAGAFFTALAVQLGGVLLPIIVLFTGFGLGSSVLQGLPRFVGDRIQPDLSRLSPAKGWSRLFGMRGAGEFLKVLVKFVGISLVVGLMLRAEASGAIASVLMLPADLPERMLTIMARLTGAMTLIAILVAGLDLVLSRRSWLQDLKMSRQEVKDEHKQAEGDPAVKGRFRSIARDRARRRMIAAVPTATLVIANPTHYAIAIRYLRAEGGAPLVVAKGQDLIALKIRDIAEAHGIPVVEDKALARAMYGVAEVDAHIPAAFYRAVAELIHFLSSRAGSSGWRGPSALAMEQVVSPASDKAAESR